MYQQLDQRGSALPTCVGGGRTLCSQAVTTMPVVDNREPQDSKALLQKLRAQARAGDDKGICQSVQEEVRRTTQWPPDFLRRIAHNRIQFNIGGSATYNIAPKNKSVLVNIPDGYGLVFLIVGGFEVDHDQQTIRDNGMGHIVRGASITLEAATAVVIVSGY